MAHTHGTEAEIGKIGLLHHICNNMEVYVDDVIVKSKKAGGI